MPDTKPRIPSLTGTASYRIPYELTESTIREIKDVRRLGLTPQIEDYLAYARATGRAFVLEVRESTLLTQELQRMIDDRLIALRRSLRR